MLHLSTRAARHVGASYICASCLAASNVSLVSAAATVAPRVTLIPHHHDRLLSTTARHAAPAVEHQSTSSTSPDGVAPPQPPPPSPPPSSSSSPSSSSPSPSTESTTESPTDSSKKKKKKAKAEKSTAKKQDEAQVDNDRQLHVLQGALAALRNVLAAQNIDVGHIAHTTSGKKADAGEDAKSGEGAKNVGTDTVVFRPDIAALRKAIEAANAAAAKVSPGKPATAAPKKGAAAKPAAAAAKKPSKREAAAARIKAKKIAKNTPEKQQAKPLPPIKPLGIVPPEFQDATLKGEAKVPYSAIGSTTESPQATYPGPSKETPKKEAPKKEAPKKEAAKKESTKKEPVKKKKGQSPKLAISEIHSKDLYLRPIKTVMPTVPPLSYGLDRVLFNPGVYYLQDPRSRVFNFDPYLSKIMPLQEFDFNALKQYVTSSKDSTLIKIAKDRRKKYTGSTSSMTSMLSHFHYLLSSWRNINTGMLSRSIEPDSVQYTKILRAPAAIFLHWKDGTYAIDADKEFDTANILSMLGKSMEKLLTLPKEEYERYRHVNSDQITQEERDADEAYHYTGFQDFMMRSQLDAHDPRVPGTGMFDLKTRAVVSIRMDAKGFEKGLGYEIRNSLGQWESFEREYYDMMRSAFLKYSLQVRMGRMDGIFVAFHNTQRIFGFQYIPLRDMDLALHGTSNVILGHREFKFSLSLLNRVFDRATAKFPKQSLRLHFETRASVGSPFMYIFAKPVTPEDIDEVQSAGKASIEAFEREVMGLNKVVEEPEPVVESQEDVAAEDVAAEDVATEEVAAKDEEVEVTEPTKSEEVQSFAAWEEVRHAVEEAMEDDEVGVGIVREAIEDALEQSGLMRARSSEEARDYVDSLLTAITGTELPKTTESPENASDEVAGEDGEAVADEAAAETSPDADAEASNDVQPAEAGDELGSAAQEASETSPDADAEASNDAQPAEAGDEPGSAVQAAESTEIDQAPDSTIDQPTEAASQETVAAADNQESTDETLFTLETPLSVEETASQDPATASSVEELEKAEANEETASQEKEEEDDEVDEDDVAESKEDSTSASDMSPLKDLIVRMAQRIDGTSASVEDTEDTLNDKSKLKAFERILGEMISRARVIESESTESKSDTPAETTAENDGDAKAKASDDADSKDSDVAANKKDAAEHPAEETEQGDLLGLVLTIKNKVNGNYVTRPERLSKEDEWTVEYHIEELPDARARRFYTQCKARRRKEFEDVGDRDTEWYQMFRGRLETHTKKGRAWRAKEEQRGPLRPVHVVDHKNPLKWEDVFGAPPAPAPPKEVAQLDVDDFDIDVSDDEPSADAAGEQAAETETENETGAETGAEVEAEAETETPALSASDIGLIDEDTAAEVVDEDAKAESTEDVEVESTDDAKAESTEDVEVEPAEEDAAQPQNEADGEAKEKSTSDST